MFRSRASCGISGSGQRVGQQADEGLKLYVDARDLDVGTVESACGKALLGTDELSHSCVDGLGRDDPPCSNGLVLADPVDAIDRLCLLGRGPGQLGEDDVRGNLQVDTNSGGGQ